MSKRSAPSAALAKKYLGALLPLVVLVSGCQDPCETGVALRNDEVTLETMVNGTILQPSTLPNTCYEIGKSWNKKLVKGSRFATKVAQDYFYHEERKCLRGHYERRCYSDSFPRGPHDNYPPRTYCDRVFVCDEVQVTPHKKDGYEQALEVSRVLLVIKNNLGEACAANAKGDTLGALANLVKAKTNFAPAEENTEYVLNKAGCFEPGRRGD